MDVLRNKLEEIENEVDRLCLQKKLSVEAEYLKRIKCRKSLRCYIKVSVKNGIFIRIDTRVINDYKNGGDMRFSDVMKRFCVVFDSNLRSTTDIHFGSDEPENDALEGDTELFEWIKDNGDTELFEWIKDNGDTEAFEVKSDRIPGNVKLIFDLENPRGIFRLSSKLSRLLMRYTDTKPNILTHLWRYVNKNGLMSIDSDMVRCDPELRDILGVDRFMFVDLSDLIIPHLCPLDYLVVDIPPIDDYTEIFDIPFEWDDLHQHPSLYSRRVHALDRKIESLKQMMKACEEREKILDEFNKNPIGFINKWLCVEMNEPCYRTPFFRNKDVQDNVFELLKRLE